MIAVDAASSDPSLVVTVEPTRILDTRTNVGLDNPPASRTSEKLQITGTVETQPPGGVAPVNAELSRTDLRSATVIALMIGWVSPNRLAMLRCGSPAANAARRRLDTEPDHDLFPTPPNASEASSGQHRQCRPVRDNIRSANGSMVDGSRSPAPLSTRWQHPGLTG